MLIDDFTQEDFFWDSTCEITRGFNPPQVDPTTGKEILDTVYLGKCSFQYGGNGSVGMQGYDEQEAPDLYIMGWQTPIMVNDRIQITKHWEVLVNSQVEKASPREEYNCTEIFLNHATRQ